LFKISMILDFFGGAAGGGSWADALTGTELGLIASPGGDIGIGRLALAGD